MFVTSNSTSIFADPNLRPPVTPNPNLLLIWIQVRHGSSLASTHRPFIVNNRISETTTSPTLSDICDTLFHHFNACVVARLCVFYYLYLRYVTFDYFQLMFRCFSLDISLLSSSKSPSSLSSDTVTSSSDDHHSGRENMPTVGVPSAPVDLTAAHKSARFITLSWRAPVHSGSSNITGYTIYWREPASDR